jgi:hypothetical protein
MTPLKVVMASTSQMVDVPTGSKAELDPPADADPQSWTQNGAAWAPAGTPIQVDPAIGKDDLYEVKDSAGATFSVVVRWQLGAPAKPQLVPGRANASVVWYATADKQYIDYYEVNLQPQPP